MSIRAISLCIGEGQFERSGDLKGMTTNGVIATGCSVEALQGQEVLVQVGEQVLVINGLQFNGLVNGKEFHSLTPAPAFGIIGWLFQTDIRGSFLDEPIIGN